MIFTVCCVKHYPFVLWCAGAARLKVADTNRLQKLIQKASDVVGVEPDKLAVVPDRRTLSKMPAILDGVSHPLHDTRLNSEVHTAKER